MLLQNKTAVIYGAGGADGAAVYLAGRTAKTLGEVADAITAAGGECEVATVDTLNEEAVEAHMASIIGSSGTIDISFNAVSLYQKGIQGTPLLELDLESFSKPIDTYTRSHFLTARAAGRRMAAHGSGVIMLVNRRRRVIPVNADITL